MHFSVFPLNSFLDNRCDVFPVRIDDVDEGRVANAGYYNHNEEEKQEKKTPARKNYSDTAGETGITLRRDVEHRETVSY